MIGIMAMLLFAYGSLRTGEPDHSSLQGAANLGLVTASGFRLVDLGTYPALITVGTGTSPDVGPAVGELYQVDLARLSQLDIVKQHPSLFQRHLISLDDGRQANAYLMADDQVRGRKRLRTGDWKLRFEPPKLSEFAQAKRWHR